MPLNPTFRGFMEQMIDNSLPGLTHLAKTLLDPERKASLRINNERDFTLGVALGIIQQTLLIGFYNTYQRAINDQELSEIGSIISNRLPHIRKAMFNAG
jgi:hypothetical protein